MYHKLLTEKTTFASDNDSDNEKSIGADKVEGELIGKSFYLRISLYVSSEY